MSLDLIEFISILVLLLLASIQIQYESFSDFFRSNDIIFVT